MIAMNVPIRYWDFTVWHRKKKGQSGGTAAFCPFSCLAGDSPEGFTPQIASIVEGGFVARL